MWWISMTKKAKEHTSHDKFVWVNSVLREYNEIKEETKT